MDDIALVFALGTALMRPHSSGHLALTSADPHISPLITLNFANASEQIRRRVEGRTYRDRRRQAGRR